MKAWIAFTIASVAAVIGAIGLEYIIDPPASWISSFMWGLLCGVIAMSVSD